jgi:hypothetical protein
MLSAGSMDGDIPAQSEISGGAAQHMRSSWQQSRYCSVRWSQRKAVLGTDTADGPGHRQPLAPSGVTAPGAWSPTHRADGQRGLASRLRLHLGLHRGV